MSFNAKLNTLSYRVSRNSDQLAFELMIDGIPFCDMVEDPGTPIIYWYLLEDGSDDDLPSVRRWQKNDGRLLTVCSCGHAGCGSVDCEVVHEGDTVIFKDFNGGGSEDWEFRFSRENYKTVISDMIRQAREHKG